MRFCCNTSKSGILFVVLAWVYRKIGWSLLHQLIHYQVQNFKVRGDLDSTRILDFMLTGYSLSCFHLRASGLYADPLKINPVFLQLISPESFLPALFFHLGVDIPRILHYWFCPPPLKKLKYFLHLKCVPHNFTQNHNKTNKNS